MHVRWYGQSAFLLTGEKRVFIDPFGDDFRYPPIDGADADVLLVTQEHGTTTRSTSSAEIRP